MLVYIPNKQIATLLPKRKELIMLACLLGIYFITYKISTNVFFIAISPATEINKDFFGSIQMICRKYTDKLCACTCLNSVKEVCFRYF